MNRPRTCAAILHNDQILMVLHKTAERTYWTLPGGGCEDGETIEQIAVREVKEETGLDVRIMKLLFEEEYIGGTSYCYLARLLNENVEPTLSFLLKKSLYLVPCSNQLHGIHSKTKRMTYKSRK